MKIRTQFYTTLLLFGVVLAAISVSALLTNQWVEEANRQENMAHDVAQGASELSYLANDYVIYRENPQLERWQARYALFSADVASLRTSQPEQRALLHNIQENTARLKDVFDSVVATTNSAQTDGEAIDPALLQISWSRLAVQSQGLVADGSRLSDLFGGQVDRLQSTNSIILVALVCIFIGYLVINYLATQRRVLKAVADLQAGASVIGAGNLGYRIDEKRNDEIGDLARAFNRMSADLETANEDVFTERQRLYEVLETLPAYVVLLDKDYHVPFANRFFRERFGESHGKRCFEYLFNRTETCENCESYKVMRTEAPHHWEWLGPDGRNYDINDFPFRDTDGSLMILEMGIDVTERKKAEAALQTERKRLFDVLETLPSMICLLTPDHHVAFANRSFREQFGESRGRRCYEYCFDKTAPCEFCESFSVLETGRPHRWEFTTPQGVIIDAHDFPFTDSDGSQNILKMYIDITDRKKAQAALVELNATLEQRVADRTAALRESEEKYRSLFENMSEGFGLHEIILDAAGKPCDYRFLELNEAFARLTGLSRENLIGRTVKEALPGIESYWIETYGKVVLTGEPVHFENYSAPLGKWYDTYAYSPAKNRFAVVFVDVTERKQAEAEIAHLASFPELNPNPIVELDEFSNILYVNPSAAALFPDLGDLENRYPFLADIYSLIKSGHTGLATRDIQVGDRWYVQTLANVPESQSYRIYARDITERKRAEEDLKQRTVELEAANLELEAFSYSVSHDLRAPLRSLEGFSTALLEDYAKKLDDQGKQYLGYIQESSDLMAQLIDDLLKLSRVTRSDMSRERVDLSATAGKIIEDLKKTEPREKVEVDIAPDITAYGDRNLLQLALENLLGNAWKFSARAASPRIEMGVKEIDGRRAYFVRDNGVGFDMKYADKLFKPFQRLHKASEFAGTGIGLATVQRIVRRHGGEVWAESRPGEGATFYFTLG
jgi:PAS domain S-box-containing protein